MLNGAVVNFIKLSLTDQTLQAKQKNLDLDGLVKFADELGYRFTADDFSNTVNALSSTELSDEDLEQVAGGITDGTSQPNFFTPSNQQLITSFYNQFLHRP